MTNYTTLNNNLKRGILRFTEKISVGLTRPDFKFVSQIIYGILASQNCHLAKIARTLDEKISMKKTIDRLSRNLKMFSGSILLFENYISKIKGYVTKLTILIVDGSDVTKTHSKKMEYLARVRDGSTGEYKDGYHTLCVTALTPGKKQPIGVYTRVYSASEPDFVSEDEEVLKALRFLGKHFKKSNIRAFDRGYDANIYYKYLIGKEEKFIIRAKKNRDVIYKGRKINIYTLAKRFKGKYNLKFKKRNGVEVDCKISIIPVKLPCRPNADLNLVICNGIGMAPLMLITNLKSDDKRLSVAVTKVYLMRWRIEEYYRFKKQQFSFEDFRVRSMKSIRNLDLLLTIAIGYIGMMSEKSDERIAIMELIEASKRIKGVKKFLFYTIAAGLFVVFARCKQGIDDALRRPPKSNQLNLFSETKFDWGFQT